MYSLDADLKRKEVKDVGSKRKNFYLLRRRTFYNETIISWKRADN